MYDTIPQGIKNTLDGAALTGGFLAFLDYAPSVVAVLSIIWLSVQLYDNFKAKYLKWKNK